MKTKDLLKLAEDPRFISGIYNYCDRWCERCSFTAHCLTYAMGEDAEDDAAAHDISNENFWQQMHAILQQTLEMIAELASEKGIDLEPIDAESVVEEKRRRAAARENPLSRSATAYADMVSRWFDEAPEQITGGVGHLTDEVIQDATEVINWYQFQIAVKIMRGLTGRRDEKSEGDSQKDSDGSVKVALIGIDRSIIAWRKLLDHLPEKQENILPILFHLEKLRRKTEQAFPNARNFIRPGFDTLHGRLVS